MINKQFVTAGRAVFTIQNNQNRHYTFKVQKPRNPQTSMVEPALYIFVKTTNEQYTYMGMLVNDKCVLTHKSKFTTDATSVKVFNFAMRLITGVQPLPIGYSVHHEGRCAKCGRPLTDPKSITLGFGPTCRGE